MIDMLQILVSSFILTIIVFNYRPILAELTIVPLWNATEGVTTNQTNSYSCHLANDSNLQDVVKFTGDSVETCSVQLISSNGTAAVIQIPQGVSVYAARQGHTLAGQMKYVSFTADEPCIFVFRHPKVQLYLQGNNENASSIDISHILVNTSALDYLHDADDVEKHASRVSQTNHCQTKEYNHLYSCNLSSNDTWSFTFPANCNATLDRHDVQFQCYNVHSNHKALIIYPCRIITLDLARQGIAEINVNSFMTLKSLNSLLLDENILVTLNRHIFNDLITLNTLSLIDNTLNSLPRGIFQSLTNLTELFLDVNKLNTLYQDTLKGLKRLRVLTMASNKLKDLPENIFSDLENLRKLDLSQNNMVTLAKDLFNGLQNLAMLYLAYNDLVTLHKGLFLGLRNLEYLTLKGNQLNSLDEDVFNDTKKLFNLELPNSLLYGLRNLNTLDLDENDLTVLPKGLFIGLTKLEILYLSRNQINSLDEELFNESNKLTKLYLKDNNLTVLPKGLFIGLTKLEILYLSRNQISSLDEELFNETNKLTKLYLNGNNLKVLPKGLFMRLERLTYLHLGWNHIQLLNENLFVETKELTFLNLRNNSLKYLPNNLFRNLHKLNFIRFLGNKLRLLAYDLFWGLSNLETLSLSSNNIKYIDDQMFKDLKSLRILYLGYNYLQSLDFNLFQYTVQLSVLDLSMNKLNYIPDIGNLSQLIFVNLKGNKLTKITKETFYSIPKKTEIIASQHEVCECYVSVDNTCTAGDDRSPYLTCDRLLSDRILCVVMWLIGLNAIGGNIFVLSRKQTKTNRNIVQTFLLRNLAMSDLLMGVYMLLIALADIYFGEYFPMQAEKWRSGITCRIAGTLAILSSEASVFFVTLISTDRFMSIGFPHSRGKLKQNSSTVVVVITWIFSLALGIVPSILAGENDKFYDNSQVCIGLPLSKKPEYNTQHLNWKEECSGDICYWKQPVETKYVGEVNGMIFASVMFLGLNFICYLVILVCYVEIVRTVFKSSQRAGLNTEMKEQIRMTAKVTVIVLTDFTCWFPIIIIGILVQAGILELPPDVFAWCVTLVLPINSAINPYLYTIAAVISSRRKQARIAAAESQQENSNRTVTRGRQLPICRTRRPRD